LRFCGFISQQTSKKYFLFARKSIRSAVADPPMIRQAIPQISSQSIVANQPNQLTMPTIQINSSNYLRHEISRILFLFYDLNQQID